MKPYPHSLPNGWSVLSSEYLYKAPWLTVRKDALRLPDGYVIPEYFVLEYPDWVNVIAITKEGEMILIRQYRHGSGTTNFELCAGVCEPSDGSPLVSARRELLEETGYGNGSWVLWTTVSANPATSNNWVHCFLARDVEKVKDPSLDAGEHLETHMFSKQEVKRMMEDGSIVQATHLVPLWKFMSSD